MLRLYRDGMNRATTFITGAISGLAAWAGWQYYRSRATKRVTYETCQTYKRTEIRRYPTVVVAETVADSTSAARNRLREYLTGANEANSIIPATTPVRTHTESLEVTTPTGNQTSTRPVRVGVYLPPGYSPQAAPEPTNNAVVLTVETPRTVAVRSISVLPTDNRFERARTKLLTTLADVDLVVVGSPFVFDYGNSVFDLLTGRAEVAIEVG